MSLGLIVFNGLRAPPATSLLSGIPSTTISGSLLALSEEPPRMRIREEVPGAPPLELIWTPATLPAIRLVLTRFVLFYFFVIVSSLFIIVIRFFNISFLVTKYVF